MTLLELAKHEFQATGVVYLVSPEGDVYPLSLKEYCAVISAMSWPGYTTHLTMDSVQRRVASIKRKS